LPLLPGNFWQIAKDKKMIIFLGLVVDFLLSIVYDMIARYGIPGNRKIKDFSGISPIKN